MIVAYTDGSFKKGYTNGAGVQFVNPERCNLQNISTEVPGTTSCARAELYAILTAIRVTVNNIYVHLHIRTDNMYSKDSLKKFYPKWVFTKFATSSGQNVKNLSLIESILSEMRDRDVTIKWTRSHLGKNFQ